MEKSIPGGGTPPAPQEQVKGRTSIKKRFVVFSVVLFLLILIGGSIIFYISMRQIVYVNTGHELTQTVEIERITLEAEVNAEIAIAMKMADSPLIIEHFQNPADPALKRIAFNEIEGYRRAFASGNVFWASDVDKEFYFSEDNHYTVDAENPDNYWYKMTLYETEKYNFNINYNPEIQRIMLWINAPVFDERRNPIGLVGTGIDLTEFTTAIYRHFKGSADLYLFNDLNEITGAKDLNLVTEKQKIDTALEETGREIVTLAKELKTGEIKTMVIHGGELAVGDISALNWYIAAIEKINFTTVLSSPMTGVFLAMMAVIAVILIIFYILISWLLNPLNIMIKTLNKISTNWDLTQKLKVKHNDETGMLGDFFNLTFGKMRELLTRIKEKTITLSDIGDELASQMTRTRKDIDGINSNIHTIRGQVLSQVDKVNAVAGSIDHTIVELNSLNDHITIQSESVSRSSAAIEEMLASVQSVTQTLMKNKESIDALAESSDAGRIDLQKVSTDIQEIAHESESLLEINSVMQMIASQTNLLSMNAAIEAAHAGEAGKGFAVVADEIRKLAENSSSQSKTISSVLKKIKAMIDEITKSTGVVLERFGTIEQEVKTVSNQETQIRNAMEEQGSGSRQILEAISQMNKVTDEVKRASSEMTTESKEVKGQSGELKRITAEIAGSMDEMTKGADEISNAVTRVDEITDVNKANIDELSTDIALFKVDA